MFSQASCCAALVGEDQPLCPDLPELDLSELDVSDLDADSFLGGLKWYSDQSEIISSQYGHESTNLFEKLEEEEQEATLLAVLTETLDGLPVDEDTIDGLPSFQSLSPDPPSHARLPPHTPAHVPPLTRPPSPSTSPNASPHSPDAHEPSLLKKLLLAPANSHVNYSQFPPSAHGNQRHRHTHSPLKAEQAWAGKGGGVSMRRPCTELLKYLTTGAEPLPSTTVGKEGVSSSCSLSSSPSSLSTSSSSSSSSRKKASSCSSSSLAGHTHLLPQRANSSSSPLPLTPDPPTDKGSPLENKAIERSLTVEISGTPGLTPPTTPPHKLSPESLFLPPPPMLPPPQDQRRGLKRPAPPNSYGDHDYCQAVGTKHPVATATPRPVAAGTAHRTRPIATAAVLPRGTDSPDPPSTTQDAPTLRDRPRPALPDQQIRAQLERHFGPPPLQEEAQEEEEEGMVWGGAEELYCEIGGYGGLGGALAELFSWGEDGGLDLPFESSAPYSPLSPSPSPPTHTHSRQGSTSPPPRTHASSWYDSDEENQHECLRPVESQRPHTKHQLHSAAHRQCPPLKVIEERRRAYVGRLHPHSTHTHCELQRAIGVFGESEECEECAVTLPDDGSIRSCDLSVAPRVELYRRHPGGHKQNSRTTYTDLDSHADDMDLDAAYSRSKYDCMDFDSLLREAQSSLRR
ncbi:hypothetical protein ACEWY4_025165 [Coilia grayii]|uniref:Peroxisome proliferator-activated receptor gamma coactivator 1-alpha n=1 Tax=Coilia grayii TaxID=363190 RepID=A0ABD1IWS1_9TELE